MLFDWALIIYGTATDPLKGNRHIPIPTTRTPALASTASSASSTQPTSDTATAISGQ